MSTRSDRARGRLHSHSRWLLAPCLALAAGCNPATEPSDGSDVVAPARDGGATHDAITVGVDGRGADVTPAADAGAFVDASAIDDAGATADASATTDAGAPSNAYERAVEALAGLALFVPLDEAAGPTAHDLGPRRGDGAYAATGVAYGATDTLAGTGVEHGAVRLAGAGDVTFAHATAFDLVTTPAARWTVVADLRVESDAPTYVNLFSSGDRTTAGFQIWVSRDGTVGYVANGQQTALATGVDFTAFVQFALVWDGSELAFYVNGAQVAHVAPTGGHQSFTTSTPLTAGVGGLTLAKLVVATAADGAALAGLYTATHGTAPPPPTGTHIPATPSAPVPASWGGTRVVLADDFNGTTLSSLWGNGLYGQGYGTDGYSKGANAGEQQLYWSRGVTMGDGAGLPSNVILRATHQPAGLPGFGMDGWPATMYYASGAITSYFGGGDSHAAATGFEWRVDQTPLIVEARIALPGSVDRDSTWGAFWASSSEGWIFEQDLVEQVADHNAVQTTTHYNAAGSGSCDSQVTMGAWSHQPTLGTDHVFTTLFATDGSYTIYMDGTQVANNPARPTQHAQMGLLLNYALGGTPPSGWPGDQMTIDYVVAWQPSSLAAGTGIHGGGVAAGTTLP